MLACSYVAVALEIGQPAAKCLSALNEGLRGRWGCWYSLGAGAIPVHITLWIASVRDESVSDLCAAVRKHAAGLRLASSYGVGEIQSSPDGFLGVRIVEQQRLRSAHLDLSVLLSPFRVTGVPIRYQQRWSDLDDTSRALVLRYGSCHAGPRFDAHITLGFVDPDRVDGAARYVRELMNVLIVTVESILVFRQVEEGKSVEILERLALKD